MKKSTAVVIFIVAAVAAWIAAYSPDMWRRHQVLESLDSDQAHWVCVINGDAVSSQYEGYITKKYIMLGGQRFYSDEFKRWGRSADYILVVIDDNMFMRWMRLDLSETDDYAKKYGIARAGCRRMESRDKATGLVMPVSPPIYNRVYPNPGSNVNSIGGFGGTYDVAPSRSSGSGSPGGSGSFDWKRAVGPALEPAGGHAGSTGGGGTGTAPAPSSGGVGPTN